MKLLIKQLLREGLDTKEDGVKFKIQDDLDVIIRKYDSLGMACWIYLKGDYAIEVASIKVKDKSQRRQGLGTALMSEITALCDNYNLLCVLTPESTESSMAGLLRFYKSFGFVSNSGRKKDFRFRNTMIRYPQNVLAENIEHEGVTKSLSEDVFIHFGSMQNGLKIKREGSLGIEGWSTFAVSAKWGIYNNGAVLPKNAEVALIFKTNKLPKYGYVEEVVWDGLVPFTECKLVKVVTAVDMLKNSEANTDVDESDMVRYTP